MHRTITIEQSTGLSFLPITIACCLCISRLRLAEKLWRLAMFIKFRSIRICKTTPDLPSPTNTAVQSQQRLNTPVPARLKNLFGNNPHLDSNPHFNLVACELSMTGTQTRSCNFLAVKQPAVIPRFFCHFFLFLCTVNCYN